MDKVLIAMIAALGLVAVFAWMPSYASAQRNVVVGERQVDYSDLDVDTYVGADRLLRRMRLSARTQCDARAETAALALTSANPLCARDAMAQAVAGLDSFEVTARYGRETPALLS